MKPVPHIAPDRYTLQRRGEWIEKQSWVMEAFGEPEIRRGKELNLLPKILHGSLEFQSVDRSTRSSQSARTFCRLRAATTLCTSLLHRCATFHELEKLFISANISGFQREKVLSTALYFCNDAANSPVRLPDGSNCEIEMEGQLA
jgi:hypothetical protein